MAIICLIVFVLVSPDCLRAQETNLTLDTIQAATVEAPSIVKNRPIKIRPRAIAYCDGFKSGSYVSWTILLPLVDHDFLTTVYPKLKRSVLQMLLNDETNKDIKGDVNLMISVFVRPQGVFNQKLSLAGRYAELVKDSLSSILPKDAHAEVIFTPVQAEGQIKVRVDFQPIQAAAKPSEEKSVAATVRDVLVAIAIAVILLAIIGRFFFRRYPRQQTKAAAVEPIILSEQPIVIAPEKPTSVPIVEQKEEKKEADTLWPQDKDALWLIIKERQGDPDAAKACPYCGGHNIMRKNLLKHLLGRCTQKLIEPDKHHELIDFLSQKAVPNKSVDIHS